MSTSIPKSAASNSSAGTKRERWQARGSRGLHPIPPSDAQGLLGRFRHGPRLLHLLEVELKLSECEKVLLPELFGGRVKSPGPAAQLRVELLDEGQRRTCL